MFTAQQYFMATKLEASLGHLHRGDNCRGWFLSEVDTWHPCGICNPKGQIVPCPDYEEDFTFVVTVANNGVSEVDSVTPNHHKAITRARELRDAGHRVRLRRVWGAESIDLACAQLAG